MDSSEVLSVLGNKYNPEILDASQEPKSAQQLSDELDIPIATCYRRVEELVEMDLLEVSDKTLSDQGRTMKLYESSVSGIEIDFTGDGEPEIDMKDTKSSAQIISDVWGDLKND